MKYIGNYDAYMNVAKEKYPGDLILQQPQIGQFVRIDSKGNLISFISMGHRRQNHSWRRNPNKFK
ncbi:MAG: hypothetical protein ACE5IR_09570 [bacterium]